MDTRPQGLKDLTARRIPRSIIEVDLVAGCWCLHCNMERIIQTTKIHPNLPYNKERIIHTTQINGRLPASLRRLLKCGLIPILYPANSQQQQPATSNQRPANNNLQTINNDQPTNNQEPTTNHQPPTNNKQ